MKKIYFGLLVLLLVVTTLLLSSCGNRGCKHKYTVENWQISPTCTEKGVGIVRCRKCNTILSTFEIEPQGHFYEEWGTIEPSCTGEGYTVNRCVRCWDHYIESNIVPPTGHTEVIIPGYESTCYSQGLTDGKVCDVCEKILVYQEYAPYAAHTYDNDEDNICNVCDYQRFCKHENTETLPAEEPTCISIGLTQGEQCLDCGEILVAQQVINVLEHNYTNLTVINPTCESKGYSIYICDCGDESTNKFDYVDELGHNYGMWYVYNDDTTAIEGEGRRDCLNGDCDKYLSHSISTELSYEIEYDRNCIITGIGDCVDSEIFIPFSIDGYVVRAIGEDAFKNCTTITGVYIPDSVHTIAKGAFNGCSSLESMTLPFVGGSSSAKEATESTLLGYIFGTEKYNGGIMTEQFFMSNINGEYADAYYSRCYYIPSSLKNITVTGEKIFYGAFYNCDSLVDVTIPFAAPAAFYDCDSLVNVTIYDGYVGDYAFYDCDSLVNVIIHNDYTDGCRIGEYAFFSSGLTAFSSDDVGQIARGAFEACTNLTYVTCPKLSYYSYASFANCHSLISVTFGELLFSVDTSDAFVNCYALIEVRHKSPVYTLVPGREAYGGISYYAKYVITDDSESNFKIVGDYIFYDNGAEIYLVKYLGDEKEITLPEYEGGKEYAIGNAAFYDKTIESVIIPDYVTSIGQYAFAGSSLENVEIGDSVQSIDVSAFSDTHLKSVFIPISVTFMGSVVFGGCDGVVIYCEASSDVGWAAWWNAIYNTSTKYSEATVYYNCSRP